MQRDGIASVLQAVSLPAFGEMVTCASDAAVTSEENLDAPADSHEHGDSSSAARGQGVEGGPSRLQGRPSPASHGAMAKPLLSAGK